MPRDILFLASNCFPSLGGENVHAHVIKQDICNKFIELFCGMYGFTAKLSVATFAYQAMSFINKIDLFWLLTSASTYSSNLWFYYAMPFCQLWPKLTVFVKICFSKGKLFLIFLYRWIRKILFRWWPLLDKVNLNDFFYEKKYFLEGKETATWYFTWLS